LTPSFISWFERRGSFHVASNLKTSVRSRVSGEDAILAFQTGKESGLWVHRANRLNSGKQNPTSFPTREKTAGAKSTVTLLIMKPVPQGRGANRFAGDVSGNGVKCPFLYRIRLIRINFTVPQALDCQLSERHNIAVASPCAQVLPALIVFNFLFGRKCRDYHERLDCRAPPG